MNIDTECKSAEVLIRYLVWYESNSRIDNYRYRFSFALILPLFIVIFWVIELSPSVSVLAPHEVLDIPSISIVAPSETFDGESSSEIHRAVETASSLKCILILVDLLESFGNVAFNGTVKFSSLV